jgi:hypothetical protein
MEETMAYPCTGRADTGTDHIKDSETGQTTDVNGKRKRPYPCTGCPNASADCCPDSGTDHNKDSEASQATDVCGKRKTLYESADRTSKYATSDRTYTDRALQINADVGRTGAHRIYG